MSSSLPTSLRQTHLLILAAGLLSMYIPTFHHLFQTIWSSDKQGHGPVVFAIACWLLWKKYPAISSSSVDGSQITGYTLFIISLLTYVAGRSQDIYLFEVGSLIVILASLILILHGHGGLRAAAFPLFFMLFIIPLPGTVVDALTQPMKMAVSYVTESVLHQVGYPISRNGVILQIGQYQLLVADACAGLNTLFTLEALGLLYLNLVKHESAFRNIILAILIVPISFIANVIRVMTLTLITYHFGDEAGQGFLHGFSGMVLFLAALSLTIALDGVLRQIGNRKCEHPPAPSNA